jgi:hypothetical protein
MMTLVEIDAAIAALEAARLAKLTGRQVVKSSYPDVGSVELATATVAEIAQEIARLKIQRAQLTGQPSGFGPVRAGFGCRP